MEQVDNLNHKFTKVEAGDKIEVTMTKAVMTSKAIRTDIGQIVETEDSIDRTEVGLDMNKITEEVISEATWGIFTDKIAEESKEKNTGMKVMIEAGTGLEKGHFPEAIIAIEIGVQGITCVGQYQEQVQMETE